MNSFEKKLNAIRDNLARAKALSIGGQAKSQLEVDSKILAVLEDMYDLIIDLDIASGKWRRDNQTTANWRPT